MLNILRAVCSWYAGRKIGEKRYLKANPWISGNFGHFLPIPLWEDKERSSLRYNVIEEEWDGLGWKFVTRHNFLTATQIKELL